MTLEITKHEGKEHVVLYRRNNGSCTWMKADDFFVQHDISHYAIEKTLHYTTAFMGMLNNGMDVKDFENREKRLQLTISKEACYAENMANLFLIEAVRGWFDDFNEVLQSAYKNMKQSFPVPVLTEQELENVRTCLAAMLLQWKQLEPEKTMILNFDL